LPLHEVGWCLIPHSGWTRAEAAGRYGLNSNTTHEERYYLAPCTAFPRHSSPVRISCQYCGRARSWRCAIIKAVQPALVIGFVRGHKAEYRCDHDGPSTACILSIPERPRSLDGFRAPWMFNRSTLRPALPSTTTVGRDGCMGLIATPREPYGP
jgi:hypothetical protein